MKKSLEKFQKQVTSGTSLKMIHTDSQFDAEISFLQKKIIELEYAKTNKQVVVYDEIVDKIEFHRVDREWIDKIEPIEWRFSKMYGMQI